MSLTTHSTPGGHSSTGLNSLPGGLHSPGSLQIPRSLHSLGAGPGSPPASWYNAASSDVHGPSAYHEEDAGGLAEVSAPAPVALPPLYNPQWAPGSESASSAYAPSSVGQEAELSHPAPPPPRRSEKSELARQLANRV